MKLKRLCLAGFKTFADKTEIEFSEGITAIVGPNGCGKSNIADAILWVMGEQNPRLLRGMEGRDFIFAGAERRKPLGMAEVQLILDNSDGSLPFDFTEVAISRRVYRSGETRYALNGATCRLKDIVDLFLDTGMGQGAYSFVGQTEVDAVLSARPEDRRELFEEAAGVQRYRARKREAVRKLETAEANLTRVNDIVAELERQIDPLREQAEVAERYLSVTARLRQVEVGLLIAEIHRCDYELYAARREREEYIAAVAHLDEHLASMEREAARVRDALEEAESEQEAATLSLQSAATHLERIEAMLRLTEERERHAAASAAGVEMEIKALAEREQALNASMEREKVALERLQRKEAEQRTALVEARARLKELEDAARRAEELGQDHARAQRRLLAERSARETALTACRTRLEETRSRLRELHEEAERHREALRRCHERLQEAEGRARKAQEDAEQATAEHRRLLAVVREAEDRKARAENEASACQRRYTERHARLQALRELQASGEGLFQGVRAVLQAEREGLLGAGGGSGSAGSSRPTRFATVADVLHVPDRLRVAIDVALGSAAQNLVCPTARDAREAIEWLKKERRGRATFLPLDSLNPSERLRSDALRGIPGVLGVASDLIQCEAACAAAVELLLNRVVIVENLDCALEAAKRLRGWSRLVTLEGELLTPGGAVTGGDGAGRGPQLVVRKGEIDDLAAETEALRSRLSKLEETVAGSDRELAEAAAVVRQAAEIASARGAESADAVRDLEVARREAATLQARLDEIGDHIRRQSESVVMLEKEEADWQSAMQAASEEDTGLDDAVEKARQNAHECLERAAEAREVVTNLQVELGRLGEQIRSLQRSLAAAEVAVREMHENHRKRQEQREELGRQLLEAQAKREELLIARKEAEERLEKRKQVSAEWSAERSRRLERSFTLTTSIQDASAKRAVTMESLHETDLLLARLELRLSQFGQRLTEEYGMTMEEALAEPEPPELDRDTVQEIARLRREIRAMGNVNTGAVDEYRRLRERYDFLRGQQLDLQEACASLRETIAEIDRNTRSVFLSTFHAVQEEFQRLFERLFGGGRTELQLTRPDNLLETGVEIIVQPPGKRAQNLQLLSGGERALTAVALLFSFFAVRPSPFVLLDEVDAPLDGSNVDRFVDLLREYSRTSQFVVITHNPATIAAATCWYGVTLREPGVSRVLSYRPPEGAGVREPAEVAQGVPDDADGRALTGGFPGGLL